MSHESTERDRVLAAQSSQIEAWSAGDLDRLGLLFDPGCLVFHGPSPVISGWKAYRKRLKRELTELDQFELRCFDVQLRVDERLDDRIAWIAARYEIKARKDGAAYKEGGRWTCIYEKRDDVWRVVHLHLSPDPADT